MPSNQMYEGVAVMYLALPMSPLSIPVLGKCSLHARNLILRFPNSKIAFDLPKSLGSNLKTKENLELDQEFKMAGPNGEMKCCSFQRSSSYRYSVGSRFPIDEHNCFKRKLN
ncbi:hypothetical protein HELRODRAFT_163352 [Helobdella robusta]|uniref:Uncharacterized protein n=1 Tax=Helobdella robusta TaxID=6412 RepID=T1ETY0_HELRO|nr:hypothetical protein HELRODRAFT_163352 [Helobdella robusta]ESN96304.1 hypothetical protein HELRODRAFT_163352 [Helobdella robusta]